MARRPRAAALAAGGSAAGGRRRPAPPRHCPLTWMADMGSIVVRVVCTNSCPTACRSGAQQPLVSHGPLPGCPTAAHQACRLPRARRCTQARLQPCGELHREHTENSPEPTIPNEDRRRQRCSTVAAAARAAPSGAAVCLRPHAPCFQGRCLAVCSPCQASAGLCAQPPPPAGEQLLPPASALRLLLLLSALGRLPPQPRHHLCQGLRGWRRGREGGLERRSGAAGAEERADRTSGFTPVSSSAMQMLSASESSPQSSSLFSSCAASNACRAS